MADKKHFSIRNLPKDRESGGRAQDAIALRECRLEALQLAPDAYASTYEIEVKFSDDIWLQRLENPWAQHFVATFEQNTERHTSGGKECESGQLEKWVGLLVVIEKHGSERTSASTPPSTYNASQRTSVDKGTAVANYSHVTGSSADTYYQLHGLFVHPTARQLGLGNKLINESYAYIRARAADVGLRSTRVDVLVDSWNHAARNLYYGCGFRYVSEDSYYVGGSARRALSLSVILNI
ncbi:hypothetical protein MMC13_007325 [Lambiella insularis]|nr:hypothetical protein [Lambiella insularis]